MAVLWRMALLALTALLLLGQVCAQEEGADQSGSSAGSEIGFRGTRFDLAEPNPDHLLGVIDSVFARMAGLVEEFTQDIRSIVQAFCRGCYLGLGLGATAKLDSTQHLGGRSSMSVDRLGFLVLGVMAVTGCIAIAARRYWYNRFWQPECVEVWQRMRELEEASSSPRADEATVDVQARKDFWDAVPGRPVSKAVLPELEYVRMLLRLGYHKDAQRALQGIEGRAIMA